MSGKKEKCSEPLRLDTFLGHVKGGPVTDGAQVEMSEVLSPHKQGLDRTTLVEPGTKPGPTAICPPLHCSSLPLFPKSCYNLEHNQQSPPHHRGLVLTDWRGGETTSTNTQTLAAWPPSGLPDPSVRQAVLLQRHSGGRPTSPHWSSVVPTAGWAMAK